MFIMSVVWNVYNDRVADRTQMIKSVFRLFFDVSFYHLNVLNLCIFVIFKSYWKLIFKTSPKNVL